MAHPQSNFTSNFQGQGGTAGTDVNLESPNQTIDIQKRVDPDLNRTTFDIDVHEKTISCGWFDSADFTYNNGAVGTDTFSLVDIDSLPNPQGDRIDIDANGKITLGPGLYQINVTIAVEWTTELNDTIEIGGHTIDLSVGGYQEFTVAGIARYTDIETFKVSVPCSAQPPADLWVWAQHISIVGIEQAVERSSVAIQNAVDHWLNEHPEATTTVEDHSLTYEKLQIGTLNFVTPEMFGAVGDGAADDTTAINNMFSGGNKFCLFKSGATYKVSGILEVDSNTVAELNGCRVSSTYDGHIFRFKGESAENHKSNFAIRNGTIIGSGLDNHVGDQGAGIQCFYADNIVIENIVTTHTYGDGLQFRETNNVKTRSCKIESFGRNGISPTSGSFVFEDIEVKGSALVGANPGNTFDCEPNSAIEPTRLVLRNSKLPRATLVDYYSDENDKFIIEALIENVEFTEAYPSLSIIKSRKGDASNVIIRNCSFTVMSNAAGLRLDNVLNVVLDGCKFRYAENAGGNTHAINAASNNVSLKIKNVDCTGLNRAIFAYNHDIIGWTFDGFKGSIYTRVFQNNELKNSDISGFETTASDTSENFGNVCIECSIPDSLRQFVTFGKSGSQFGGLLASNEFVRTGTAAFDVFIPLPSIDESKGHCYFLSIGYSHRGRVNFSGQKLVSILAQEGYAGVTITDVFSTGDKTIVISQATGKRGLVASFEANTSGVVVSYTLFG